MSDTLTISARTNVHPTPAAGASDAAQFISAQIGAAWRALRSSVSLGFAENAAIASINEVAQECSQPNWDGYGAAAVLPRTIHNARRFVETLPLGAPAPTAGADPDGDVTLEWYRSPRYTLSVSISPDGDVHYGALLGASKMNGSEPFFDEVPKPILELIGRVSAP